jgi:pyruvate/2-oxoglutarate dehydrogenase complex dihydrolipoamide acyltransferase (E2) component
LPSILPEVGVIQKRAVVINDAIAIRPMVYLSLTFDHRILDGASADWFLGRWWRPFRIGLSDEFRAIMPGT